MEKKKRWLRTTHFIDDNSPAGRRKSMVIQAIDSWRQGDRYLLLSISYASSQLRGIASIHSNDTPFPLCLETAIKRWTGPWEVKRLGNTHSHS